MQYVIFDIDNTIADQTERETLSTKDGKLDWELFKSNELLDKDKPIHQTIELLHLLNAVSKYGILIVTARGENNRETTENWLCRHNIEYECLYMRKDGDFRPDVEMKEELYEKELKKYDVAMVFDDRPRIIKMWQSKGLFTFECNNKKGDW